MLSIDLNRVSDAVVISPCARQGQVQLAENVAAGKATSASSLFAQVDLNQQMAETRTALHYASRNEDGEGVGALLAAGASPNCVDAKGFTPLQYAALLGQKGPDVHGGSFTRTLLLHNGASVY